MDTDHAECNDKNIPAADNAIASGSTVAPNFAPRTRLKNSAAVNSPLDLISSTGATKK